MWTVAYTDLGRYDEALADFDRALAAPDADQNGIEQQRDRCVGKAAASVASSPDAMPAHQSEALVDVRTR
jgi:tetratricopeptide (TPR) repeat protein